MGKKIIKYILTLLVVVFIAYNSVYFKKLSEVKAAAAKVFDPAAYARTYLEKKLLPAANGAPDADALLSQMKNKPADGFKTNGHALDIGNTRYFMVKGQGMITSIDENDVY